MTAVSNSYLALGAASEELKADKEVVMAAVSNNSDALEYASEELKQDPDILALIESEK